MSHTRQLLTPEEDAWIRRDWVAGYTPTEILRRFFRRFGRDISNRAVYDRKPGRGKS